MKKIVLLSLLIIPLISLAQTKILDSKVDWSGNDATLVVYLSGGTDITSLEVEVGTQEGDNDLFSDVYSGGNLVLDEDYTFVLPLGAIGSSSDRYVSVVLNLSGDITDQIEYKAN